MNLWHLVNGRRCPLRHRRFYCLAFASGFSPACQMKVALEPVKVLHAVAPLSELAANMSERYARGCWEIGIQVLEEAGHAWSELLYLEVSGGHARETNHDWMANTVERKWGVVEFGSDGEPSFTVAVSNVYRPER